MRPLILAYHAVSGAWPSRLAIAPHVLREQLGRLSRLGFVGLTLSEAERRRRDGTLPERAVVVTFDDGYASILQAEPILAEFGFPGTIFIVTSFVGSREAMVWPGLEAWSKTEHAHELRPLGWDALEGVIAAGWEVGSHTVNHRLLTSLSAGALEAELTLSREAIAARLGTCTSLAYPYGVSDPRVEEAASRAGYEVACSLSFSHQHDGPFRRQRLELTSRDSGIRLLLQLKVILSFRRTRGALVFRKFRVGRHWLPSNAGEGLEVYELNLQPPTTPPGGNGSRPAQREPIATVVMCVRNGERYVMRAINSVLTQTRDDFELIVVDDASTDRTQEVLERITDSRVLVVRQADQGGAGNARNLGLSHARGKYIVILDADDVALPWRLEHQLEFLEQRPDIAIVGSPTIVIDEDGIPRGLRTVPGDPLAVRWTALLKSPFAHSSVMFRADVLKRFALSYDQAFAPSEDYDLCARVLEAGEGENTLDPLVFYRVHPHQLSNVHRERQLRLHHAIVHRTIERELPDFQADEEQLRKLWQLFSGIPADSGDRAALGHLYLDLFAAFRARHATERGADALTRAVVQSVLFRCLVPPGGDGWRDLTRRLLALDPTAVALFPLGASGLALRRARWCWSPQIRRTAALGAFSESPQVGPLPHPLRQAAAGD